MFEFEAKASGSASADTTGAFSIKGTLSVGGSVGAALDFGFISATVKGGIEATCDAINIARAAGGSWTLSAMTGDVTGQVVFEGELKIPGLSDIFDGFVAGNKITYPLTKKGTFLTFSGGGIHIPGSDKPDDGRMIPATVTTPWSVSVGPDLQDLLVRLGLATERAKSGLGKAVLSKVDRIIKDTAFKSLHEVRDKVLAFENRLNDRIHELRELSAIPDSGPYKDAYGELLAELIVFEKGLWNVSNMESGAQDAEMEVGRVQQHINQLRARIFNSGLPTPKQRSAGVLDTNEAEARRLIREKAGALEEQARHTAGHILQGKKPDQVFTKGSPAWEKFRVANNFYFKGNDQRVKGQHEAAIQSYEQAIDTYKQVRNYPGRKG
ncbi:MAG: hypothetical protein AAFS10_07980 [Myxococcota bacterium]